MMTQDKLKELHKLIAYAIENPNARFECIGWSDATISDVLSRPHIPTWQIVKEPVVEVRANWFPKKNTLVIAGKYGSGDRLEFATNFKALIEAKQAECIAELTEAVTYAHSQLLMVVNDINNDKVSFDGDEFHETLNKCAKALAKAMKDSKSKSVLKRHAVQKGK
jgi:hypothetical protein